jgi:nicotinamidase-related amidase
MEDHVTESERKKSWVKDHLPLDYQEIAKKKHLPMPGRVGYGERPAVLVIDMAKAWTDAESPMGTDMTDAIINIKKILDVARQPELKIPIFFSIMEYDPSLKGITEVHTRKRPHLTKQLVKGSPWLEIDPRLERRPDELLMVKEHGSCFTDTVLLRMMISNKCDTLIITGCSTSFCVMATCYDASTLGFHGIVPAEAVADRDPIMHKYMLLNLDWKVVDVDPLEKVLEYLSQLKNKE